MRSSSHLYCPPGIPISQSSPRGIDHPSSMDSDCHGSSIDSRLLLTAGRPIQLDAPFAHRQGHLRGPPEWAFRPPTRLPRLPARQHGLFAHRHGHLVRQHEQPTRQRGLFAHRHEYLVNLLAHNSAHCAYTARADVPPSLHLAASPEIPHTPSYYKHGETIQNKAARQPNTITQMLSSRDYRPQCH